MEKGMIHALTLIKLSDYQRTMKIVCCILDNLERVNRFQQVRNLIITNHKKFQQINKK